MNGNSLAYWRAESLDSFLDTSTEVRKIASHKFSVSVCSEAKNFLHPRCLLTNFPTIFLIVENQFCLRFSSIWWVHFSPNPNFLLKMKLSRFVRAHWKSAPSQQAHSSQQGIFISMRIYGTRLDSLFSI